MPAQTLRKHKLKVTSPRLNVLSVLEQTKSSHLSAENIHKQLIVQGKDLGLATVYRVLSQFERVGLVHRHHFDGGNYVYELGTEEHHDHLVCLSCSAVLEFYDASIEMRQQHIAEQKGFLMKDHRHTIYGLCQHCQSTSHQDTP